MPIGRAASTQANANPEEPWRPSFKGEKQRKFVSSGRGGFYQDIEPTGNQLPYEYFKTQDAYRGNAGTKGSGYVPPELQGRFSRNENEADTDYDKRYGEFLYKLNPQMNAKAAKEKYGYEPPPPPETPEQRQRRLLAEEAAGFRKGLSKFKQDQFEPLAEQGMDELKNVTKTIRTNAVRRGLFDSGYRTAEETGARGRLAGMLARQRADINREADELATAKDEVSANVGLQGFADAIARQNRLFEESAMADRQRRAGIADLGEGVGRGLGTYYEYEENKRKNRAG